MPYAVIQWFKHVDWEDVLLLIRGSDYVWGRRMKEFRKEIDRADQHLAFRGRVAVLQANRKPIERQTSRKAGIFSPVLVLEPAPSDSESLAPELVTPTVYTPWSGDRPVLAPCNFSPGVAAPPANNPEDESYVPLRAPTTPVVLDQLISEQEAKIHEVDPCRYDGECQNCRIAPRRHDEENAHPDRNVPTELGYLPTTTPVVAQISDRLKTVVTADTIAQVLDGNASDMVGFDRWRHRRDISIKALEELIESELRGPGVDALFGEYDHDFLAVEDHPLVIEHRKRLAAADSGCDSRSNADSRDMYAIKTIQLQPQPELFKRAKSGIVQPLDDKLVMTHPMEEMPAYPPLGPPFTGTGIILATKRQDSGHEDDVDDASYSDLDSDLRTLSTSAASSAAPDPSISSLAKAIKDERQASRSRSRSQSIDENTHPLTRTTSSDSERRVRFANTLAQTITFNDREVAEEAIASTDDEADGPVAADMQPLTRMHRRMCSAPDWRPSDSSSHMGSGVVSPVLVTSCTNSLQAGPSARSTPPTSLEPENASLWSKVKTKFWPNSIAGSVQADQSRQSPCTVNRRSSMKGSVKGKTASGQAAKSVTFASEITSFPASPVNHPPTEQAVPTHRPSTVTVPTISDEIPCWATPPPNYALRPVVSRGVVELAAQTPIPNAFRALARAKATLERAPNEERRRKVAAQAYAQRLKQRQMNRGANRTNCKGRPLP